MREDEENLLEKGRKPQGKPEENPHNQEGDGNPKLIRAQELVLFQVAGLKAPRYERHFQSYFAHYLNDLTNNKIEWIIWGFLSEEYRLFLL